MFEKVLLRVLLVATTALVVSSHALADVYRWVDPRNGEIYFAETPPPPEITTEYENVTHKLEKPSLTRQAQPKQSKGTSEKATAPQADSPKNVPSDTALLLLHKCQELTAQIDSLERKLAETDDPDTMDSVIVELAGRESLFKKVCK